MRIGILATVALISILLTSHRVSAYSPKEGNVLATFGVFTHQTNFVGSSGGAMPSVQFSGGFVANGDISDRSQIEVAVFRMNKRYYRDQDGVFVGEETDEVHIGLGWRRWLTKFLSSAILFSSAYSMGEPRIIHNEFAPATPIDTSARDTAEYAFDFSIQGELWSRGRYAVTLDALYSLSVTGKPNERADHYGAFLGLRYFIQEKQIVEKPKDAI